MKEIKIRDLAASGFHYPLHSLYQTVPFEEDDGTPRTRYTTAWFLTDLGYFRIDLSIVGPKLKQPKGKNLLSDCKPQDILKELLDLVAAFNKETLGEDAIV